MSNAQQPLPLADDGKPKVDVLALAAKLMMPLSAEREATMVSTREVRAMAEAIVMFDTLCGGAAHLVEQIAQLDGMAPGGPRRKALGEATLTLEQVAGALEQLGYMEAIHARDS